MDAVDVNGRRSPPYRSGWTLWPRRALRSPRVYKPGFTHEVAMQMMLVKSPGHFDPALLEIFRRCADRFNLAYSDIEE